MSTADEVRAGLSEAGSRRTSARRTAHVEMLEIERLVREGAKAGLAKSEMAALARVSRQTIHDILGSSPTRDGQP